MALIGSDGAANGGPAQAPNPSPQLLDLEAYQGEVVLLDFWASWCGPCRDSFPWMQEVQREYGERGLRVIAVNVDEDRAAAEAFLASYNVDFQIAYDPEGTLPSAYNLPAMPSSVLIDRDGTIAYRHAGFRKKDRKGYAKRIEALLSGASVDAGEGWLSAAGGGVKPWERGVLADPEMALDYESLELDFDDHIYFSKEGSSGGRGFGGGGCGCN